MAAAYEQTLEKIQDGRMNWVTALFTTGDFETKPNAAQRVYVLGVANHDFFCRRVESGWGKPEFTARHDELRPHNCQDVEGSEAGKVVKHLWRSIGGK